MGWLIETQPQAYGDLHWGIGAILAMKLDRLGGMERWLGHEARLVAVMRLGRVNQEGMTEVDRAGLTRGECDRTTRRRVEPLRQL